MSGKFEIRDQIKLPLSKCVELVVSGIQFRLFRASITVAIIALAVAFLMTILGDSLIGRRVGGSLMELTKPRRTFLFWIHRLSAPVGPTELGELLRTARTGDPRWEELKNWGGCDDAALADLKDVLAREETYRVWFAGLKEGQRRRLVGRVHGRDIFAHLQDPAALETFEREMGGLGKPIPGSRDGFRLFLTDWARSQALCRRIAEGHAKAVENARALFGDRSVQEWLAAIDARTREELGRIGFRMTDEEAALVRERAAVHLDVRRVEAALRNPTVKQRIAIWYGVKDLNRVNADLLFEKLCSRREVRRFIGLLEELKTPLGLTENETRNTALDQIRTKRLAEIEAATSETRESGGRFGFSPRVLWLILVSLIVCAVGITNAMLMSVTERFKEIATMKCLGATDGFIMINFLLESGLQGLAGGVIGALLGLLLGILRSSWSFGGMAVQNLPVPELAVVLVLSVVAGVVLSVIAAIYPAWAAARLAPMEAMRVE